ncbi:MAG TPA: glycosyltransferase [Candidatus Krumholzibacteria bacterium]|nr:glycosyltransferase [Candidatus Krumholzibacteria bacterium]
MLSVVVPTYRKADLLRRTLEALADQWLPDAVEWEVVVVDDGSDDEGATDAVLEDLAARIPLVEAGCGRNEGRARARNRGWRAARGRWILFLDDDIVLRSGALVAHVEAQRAREGVHLGTVVTAPEIVDSALFDYLDTRGVAKCPPASEVPSRYLLTQNVSIPRAALERVGGFDEDFGAYGFEDMEIAFRLEDHAGMRFYALPAAVGEHVHHHSLDEYLQKKVVCGRETLPRLAELHPHRLAEMKLDVLPGLSANAAASRRALAVALAASWSLGFPGLVRALLLRWPDGAFSALRHRAYDYAVLSAYAAGLRQRTSAISDH